MIGFLWKKGFFDLWDNFLSIVLFSIGYVVNIALFVLAGYVGTASAALSMVILILDVLLFSFYTLGISGITKTYSEFRRNGLKPFFEAIRYHWGHALLHSGIMVFLVLFVMYILPFYLSMGSLVGTFLSMVMFWVLLITVLSVQYFFPLCLHMEGDSPFKTLKKCFIVCADNVGTTLFLFVRSAIGLALTILTATLIPGLAGISLFEMDTIRLLMLKYDWLEANPESTKKDINWADLLYDERKLVGPRSLKSMIFPWKD